MRCNVQCKKFLIKNLTNNFTKPGKFCYDHKEYFCKPLCEIRGDEVIFVKIVTVGSLPIIKTKKKCLSYTVMQMVILPSATLPVKW